MRDRFRTLSSVPSVLKQLRRMRGAGKIYFIVAIFVCTCLAPALVFAADISLGVIAGMTGPGASYGHGIAQGAEMATREINAAGGINGRKLKLVIVDDASSPARSAIAMRRLVASNVDLIVGGWGSPQVLANMDIAEQSGIPYIVVGATHPKITSEMNRWTFRVIQSDRVMTEQLAGVVLRGLGLRRIAVLSDSNDYGVANRDIFIAALARSGASPVEVQSYQTTDQEFTVQLNRIKVADADGIAIFGTIPAAPSIMNQARALGLKARFVGTGGLANETLISLAPMHSAGTVLMTYFNEETDAETRAWAARFRREFAGRGELPRPVLAAWEYRAIHSIAAPCLAIAGPDRMRLRDCIAGWKGKLLGVTGEAYFDKTGQLVQSPMTVEVREGAFRLHGSTR